LDGVSTDTLFYELSKKRIWVFDYEFMIENEQELFELIPAKKEFELGYA
jgi:hypothetical protein